jgi:actin related protein 2/3 complex subunit 1A/1B
VAWHPNSVLLAAGSTDAHARVFSSFIKGVDARPEPTAWGERLPFNTVCGEYMNNSAGWVHSVSFSPSGDALAFAAHDSSITVVYPSAPEQPPKAVLTINTQLLPFMSLLWNGEAEIIAAGYDCEAFRFQGGIQGWQLTGAVETKGRPGLGDQREESALNMFKQMDLKGKTKDDTQLKTVHQNTVTTLRPYETSGASLKKFSCKSQSRELSSGVPSADLKQRPEWMDALSSGLCRGTIEVAAFRINVIMCLRQAIEPVFTVP